MRTTKKKFQLPKAFTVKWLRALRSGEFKQTISQLYNPSDDGYCCLGVALKIAGHRIEKDRERYRQGFPEEAYIKCRLPEQLTYEESPSGYYTVARAVADMNDAGKNFNEIADWIEKNVELV